VFRLDGAGQRTLRLPGLRSVVRVASLVGLGSGCLEGLLKVCDDVVDVLGADGDTDEVLEEKESAS
jgi:hypothetical protein